MPQKFVALMLTAWVGSIIGDAVWFRFVQGPVRNLRS